MDTSQEDAKTTKQETPNDTNKPAYGNRSSVMKWVLIYLVIGIVVYGAWYYFAAARNNGATDTNNATNIY